MIRDFTRAMMTMMKKYFTICTFICIFLLIIPVLLSARDTVSVSIISYYGRVEITRAGMTDTVPPESGMALNPGDAVRTGKDSYLELSFGELHTRTVRIEERSHVVLLAGENDEVELIDGGVFTVIDKLGKGKTFQVKTPCAVCGARGTAWQTSTDGKTALVSVAQDRVFVKGVNKDGSYMKDVFWVDEGFESKIRKFEKPGKINRITGEKRDLLKSKMRMLRKRSSGTFSVGLDKMENKDKARKISNKMEDQRRESIIDRKGSEKRDDILDRSDRDDNQQEEGGGKIVIEG